ncbi:metallophosphatase [Autumnicola psychrophila]|uniref:Metallophosphatase n=1 Tax=Autumnicola psychrophila TaxID=3075592 RepID=A0ABU3DVH0_9FLAO|nr:metallophosphatase [Zunongwangia sp. F225]MDT0687721.1 metallophosphatase [Zunongwangia sp. F225]
MLSIPKSSFCSFLKLQITALLYFIILSPASAQQDEIPEGKEISHSVYFTANTGLNKGSEAQRIFRQIVEASKEDEDASVVLLGNITENGYPEDEKERKATEAFLRQKLLQPLKDFNGNVILNPGVNEWRKGGGQENLDYMESFLQDNSEAEFWPNDGCAREPETLSDEVELIMIDSQWFLEDWDDHPYINNKCELKTREQFFVKFKDDLKDEQNKTIIVAVHHPVMSNTKRGFFDKVGGFSRQSYYNDAMQELRGRLETLASQFDDVIFVSGNDRNMQYLEDDGIPQIISGAAAATEEAKIHEEGHFASDKNGFTKLTVFKDRSSIVRFYEATPEGPELLFSKFIKRERTRVEDVNYPPNTNFTDTYNASVYTDEETDKSGFYKWLWGEHYRDIYSRDIEVPVLFLSDLPGNPKPISEGGGNQSRSLRIIDDEEHEYTLREIRKSALRFIQTKVKTHYVQDRIDNTLAESIVQDYYTTSHPYAPFAVNDLSTAVDIYHANPQLFYLPKQKELGIFNDGYGNKLYMLEEHVGDENKDFETFGSPDDIISTADLLLELRESKDSYVHEGSYIKARLFDMLIGDWDRHEDQWRWAQFEQADGRLMYKPIARDRDQAFSKYDGPLINLLKMGVPNVRAMQTFSGEKLEDVKWFNVAAYPLDKTLIKTASWEDWKEQANFIQNELSDEKIDAAFEALPEDTKDQSIERIRQDLKERRDNLLEIARDYYKYLLEFEVIIGTEEDDKFEITRKDSGITEIVIRNDEELIFENTYNSDMTDEIWIYGLDGDDEFNLEGEGNDLIKLKVIGGEENDIYNFSNTRNAKLYDYKSKKNTIKTPGANKWLVDSYDINNYDPDKRKTTTNVLFPSVGFDPDAGFRIGLADTYSTYGLARNPFTTQHNLSAFYYFATSGFEVNYSGEFAHIFYNWNFGIDARYTSPNYTLNYFGTGNETIYNEDAVSMDYNRVRISQWSIAPSLIWRNNNGAQFHFKPIIESLEVEGNNSEYVGQVFDAEDDLFDNQIYGGAEIAFQYTNKPMKLAFPRRGIEFDVSTGYKKNIDEHDNEFAYLKPSVSVVYPLHESGIVVLATKLGSEFIFGENYEFYHGATLGGNHSLRGFRNERFNGKSAFYQSTDLRAGLLRVETGFVPLRAGISLGYDYGRVWTENDNSEKWHNNYGGSVWINAFSAITGNIGYYTSDEDNRFMFTLGFNF